jgi:hypothetical protein
MSLAAELAERFDAALIGVSAWAPRPAFAVDSAAIESVPDIADLQVMEDLLKATGERFRATAGTAAGTVEWRSALKLPTEVVLREVRSADLVVIGSTRHPVLRDPYRCNDPGIVLLRAGRPILLVPPGVTALAGKRVAVAWRDTREARRAIVDALPFLQKAETVAIVEFCELGEETSAQRHLDEVTQFLLRHETGYRFGAHVFAPGEYVSIRDHDNDETHTFKVASVESARQSGLGAAAGCADASRC